MGITTDGLLIPVNSRFDGFLNQNCYRLEQFSRQNDDQVFLIIFRVIS